MHRDTQTDRQKDRHTQRQPEGQTNMGVFGGLRVQTPHMNFITIKKTKLYENRTKLTNSVQNLPEIPTPEFCSGYATADRSCSNGQITSDTLIRLEEEGLEEEGG